MKPFISLAISALIILSGCSKNGSSSDPSTPQTPLDHGAIVLGSKLNNPYTTSNMTKALEAVCDPGLLDEIFPLTKAGTRLPASHHYVRMLPVSKAEAEEICDLGLAVYDHPLDYRIERDGDWYHDPAVPERDLTYLYCVAPVGFDFGDIPYEVLSECYIPEEKTKDSPVDWDLVEKAAFALTGNSDFLRCGDFSENPDGTKGSKDEESYMPVGQILMSDPSFNSGKPFGVAGVKVMCNVFVKVAATFTDKDGRYSIPKSFSKNVRYRIVFENSKGFAQGVDLVLLKGSVSALGTGSPKGLSTTITPSSDRSLYRRCAVNNAAYDYYERCTKADMNIALPPHDLRIWTLSPFTSSSAPMAHHKALTSISEVKQLLGDYAPIANYFLPDLILGIPNGTSYSSIYSLVCHELAHSSHFSNVGADYWSAYIKYILSCMILDGQNCYGDGTRSDAGYCEVGEMWAYYLAAEMFRDRYGVLSGDLGNEYWFRPQTLRYLSERGFSRAQIFEALTPEVTSKDALWDKLLDLYPSRKMLIDQAFYAYQQ